MKVADGQTEGDSANVDAALNKATFATTSDIL
jgi:hypothetical protein